MIQMTGSWPSSGTEFMSQTNNGKPKKLRRGRPAIGRDPVVAVRLPHETITGCRSLGQDARALVTIGGGPLHDYTFSCVH